ncbi:hypothetical protein HMPREF0004_3118 [Achromobacter piechaudii ATCC 43553]|uniref:Uncharacterized protein n=1 Tax=Achromobacter piechaudii ATCC 43553 TaxID=742159 RepID=D4XCC1_9BURK|nr:hypothetical protein HMPREF0004_3118 [Achromobacter piechaudii ATCC 43553]
MSKHTTSTEFMTPGQRSRTSGNCGPWRCPPRPLGRTKGLYPSVPDKSLTNE